MSTEQIMARQMIMPELSPSDFKLKVVDADRTHVRFVFQAIYISVMVVCCIAVAMMYMNRGVGTVLSVIAYLFCLSSMSVLIRNIYVNFNFGYPQFVTSLHGLMTTIAALAILSHRKATTGQEITIPTTTTLVQGLTPVAAAFALSLGTGNLALLYSNAHFYEMLSATSLIATAGMGIVMGRSVSPKLYPPLMLITLACMIVAFGEVKATIAGCVFTLGSVVFRALKAQVSSILMSKGAMQQTFDPLELTLWTAIQTFIIMLVWSLVAEGLAPWKAFWNIGTIGAVGLSAVAAAMINISALFVMKELGPVGQQIIGNLKGILACVGAVAAFGESITFQQVLGYALVIVGAYWYNRTDSQVQADAAEEKLGIQAKEAGKA